MAMFNTDEIEQCHIPPLYLRNTTSLCSLSINPQALSANLNMEFN